MQSRTYDNVLDNEVRRPPSTIATAAIASADT